jgi:hypothetical protein
MPYERLSTMNCEPETSAQARAAVGGEARDAGQRGCAAEGGDQAQREQDAIAVAAAPDPARVRNPVQNLGRSE